MKKISIIIPCKEIDAMTEKCISECLRLNYPDFEILVLPDEASKLSLKKLKNKKIKIIKTGKVKPAFKRNLGMKKAKGKFFAFVDSDAYPEKNWLKNAVKYFDNKEVGIVGGPNLTPREGNFWEKVSGYILSSFFVSGKADIRYKITKNRYTHELPSCNYVSRKEASSEYDECYLTAEDSKFCFICKKRGYKILYANDVIVYHHRRDSLKKHLKQMWIYGRDIAWLIKKGFSFDKLYYSILSLFVIGFTVGVILSFFNLWVRIIFLFCLLIYFLIMLVTSIHENFKISFWVFAGSISTHFWYGLGFLYGILFRNRTAEASKGLNVR